MSIRQKRAAAIGFLLMAATIGVGYTFAQPSKPVAPEKLLPASAVMYLGVEGGAENQSAFEQTAAYDALYKSGLMDALGKVFSDVQSSTGGEQGMAGQLGGVINHVQNNGVSFAIAMEQAPNQPPLPWAVLVAHNAGMYSEGVLQLALMASRGEIQFEETEIQGRDVTHGILPNTPGIEVGWWAEGEHLVIVAGMKAVDSAIKVAAGGRNITTNPLWKKYVAGKAEFDVTTVGWLNFEPVLAAFGPMPIPESANETNPQGVTIGQAAKIAGLDGLKSFVARTGYKGRAMWTEVDLNAPGPRRGLLAMIDQEPMSFDDLPSIPVGAAGFTATSFDWAEAYDAFLDVAHEVEKLLPAERQGQIDQGLAQANEFLGFDIRDDLLEPLGNVHCGYADAYQGPFGLGAGVLISVDDAEKLRESIDKLLEVVSQQSQGKAVATHVEKHGADVIVLELGGGGMSPALTIGDDWLAIGIVPQTVETFLMREQDLLPSWEPDAEIEAALAEVPKEFTAITITDPRAGVRFIAGLAPFAIGMAKTGIQQSQLLPPDAQLNFSVADMPPAEVIAQPLFPNVSVAQVSDDGVRYTTRASLSGIPFGGAVDGGTAVTTTAVLTALLLPAVQQAREAARRTQSRNNLKQMMLAMHNYHDAFNYFPVGTYPNEKLEPEERLSWFVSILPFLDQAPLYNQIDLDAGWEDEANSEPLMTTLPVYQNPSNPPDDSEYPTSHYVGIAGLGEDGPTLPVTSRKAGVFAYNRETSIRDIRDGTSNTIAIADSSEHGPWFQGGRATIRPLTEKPYINGPDGIGGPHQGGINVGLCDGSVRFVSENIDPSVFEALTTINGGEVVGEF